MTPVERVARAIERVVNPGPGGEVDDDNLREMARAALAAMREPSEGMVEAGWNARGEAQDRYRAMIDKALEEG